MNTFTNLQTQPRATTQRSKALVVAIAALVVTACAAPPTRPAGADAARSKLTQLQADSQLATRAPVAIQEAELAVRAAETPRTEKEAALGEHLVVIADRKVDIARAQAQSRLLTDERTALSEQRETARLDSRTREVDRARTDASAARSDADSARGEAVIARDAADAARADTETAKLAAEELQRQMNELNAKTTERGLVVTLGDVLFETGKSQINSGSATKLDKLAAFLNKYADHTVAIEGHTDNVGEEENNQRLSQRRAEAVKAYLVAQGVSANRLIAKGLGETAPVATNDSISGRQQNRRVEAIIANTVASL
jgi:outer membrane protein OmpA-like peptidoglycan-associated protein